MPPILAPEGPKPPEPPPIHTDPGLRVPVDPTRAVFRRKRFKARRTPGGIRLSRLTEAPS
jgi:hypothetical protein